MRHRSATSLIVAVGLAGFVAVLVAACGGTPASGPDTQRYQAPRSAYGDGKPDLNGIWQALNTANWNVEDHQPGSGYSDRFWQLGALVAEPPGVGVVEGGTIPYQTWALERRKENFANRLVADVYKKEEGDAELKCYLPGPVRANYMPYPFQLVQTNKYVTIAYQFANASRIIHMDKPQEPPVDTWMGWSNGRCDGDTLVVETTGLNGHQWFDRAGNFMSEGTKVTERWTRIGPDHLEYEATIEDPKVYTRPWKIRMPLYRIMDRNAQLLEFKCVEYSEEALYGRLTKQPKGTH